PLRSRSAPIRPDSSEPRSSGPCSQRWRLGMGEAKRKDLVTQELGQLGQLINEEYAAAKSGMATFLQHAMNCGDHRHEAKEKAGKNVWVRLLEGNTKVPQTTASLYMRLASSRPEISNALVNDPGLSITKALELLPKAAPRGKHSNGAKPPATPPAP